MIDFLRAGGVASLFVLAFGLVTLGAGIFFMWRPSARLMAFIKSFSISTTFASLAGVSAGFGTMMSTIPRIPEWSESPDLHLIVMTGLGECVVSPILGFTLLSLAWMFTALGHRREG